MSGSRKTFAKTVPTFLITLLIAVCHSAQAESAQKLAFENVTARTTLVSYATSKDQISTAKYFSTTEPGTSDMENVTSLHGFYQFSSFLRKNDSVQMTVPDYTNLPKNREHSSGLAATAQPSYKTTIKKDSLATGVSFKAFSLSTENNKQQEGTLATDSRYLSASTEEYIDEDTAPTKLSAELSTGGRETTAQTESSTEEKETMAPTEFSTEIRETTAETEFSTKIRETTAPTEFSTQIRETTAPLFYFPFLNIIMESLSECALEDPLRFDAVEGFVWFDWGDANSTMTGSASRRACELEINVPNGFVVHVYNVSLRADGACFSGDENDGSDTRFLALCDFDGEAVTSAEVYSQSNSVIFELTVYQPVSGADSVGTRLQFYFKAVPPGARPQLELVFLSPTAGYIQTPGWNGERQYPANMDSWVRVEGTGQHIMLSFQDLSLEPYYDFLDVYFGGDTTDHRILQFSGFKRPPPDVFFGEDIMENAGEFNANRVTNAAPQNNYTRDSEDAHAFAAAFADLYVHFTSDFSSHYSGFRMFFSFHNWSALPQRLEDGKWNCSVPHWLDFQHHIPQCNFQQDCSDGEDEVKCPYMNHTCGAGWVLLAGSCYRYFVSDKRITWNEASLRCLQEGARLASASTPEAWKEVMLFLESRDNERVYIGLQSASPLSPQIYQDAAQWTDGRIAYFASWSGYTEKPFCGLYDSSRGWMSLSATEVSLCPCNDNTTAKSFLCKVNAAGSEAQRAGQSLAERSSQEIEISTSSLWTTNSSNAYVTCPEGHVTYNFLACDVHAFCWSRDDPSGATNCVAPFFTCSNGAEWVPYSLVCDHRADCGDTSDEDFCVFPPCRLSDYPCSEKQCVPLEQRCDKVEQCTNGADERHCSWFDLLFHEVPKCPAILDFDGKGSFSVRQLDNTDGRNISCPDAHFQCPGKEVFCVPVYVRCNGVYDCLGKEDEADCDSYTCPGFYRCRGSTVCLHQQHVCDGINHCPRHDDELLCDVTCPAGCTCYGMAFVCTHNFSAALYPELRYLDARGSGMAPGNVSSNTMLVYLSLAQCRITHLPALHLPNLHALDLSDNLLASLDMAHLAILGNLKALHLVGNPLDVEKARVHADTLPSLRILDLSRVYSTELPVSVLLAFPNIRSLNLSGCGVQRVPGEGFRSLEHLRMLDTRGCPLTEFPRGVLDGLDNLHTVLADNYKLCCPQTLPSGFNLANCHAPRDEVSSCDALLRSDFYRVVLSLFSALALLGNVGSFVYRVLMDKASSRQGFGVFVAHLCIADFLMGVYLAMIGVADRLYQGSYLWKDSEWKGSVACKVAGFLSLLSSEVSAFLICLITLDRFLVLRFPFSRFHFGRRSAHLACASAWVLGLVLAAVPLLPVTSHWAFYSQTGICIPLPITRTDFDGHTYSFSVVIVLNFILFLFIAAGQVFIYWSVRTNSMSASDTTKRSNDLTVARRLITIAMSDFLCWFPIGLLGLLAADGVPIPGEVNVAVAIIVLPINSALNPFLYTLNMLLERRRKAQERRMSKLIMSRMDTRQSEIFRMSPDRKGIACTENEAWRLLGTWLSTGLVSRQAVRGYIDTFENFEKEDQM